LEGINLSTSSSIEWTDATWNTLSGCTRISEGCLNCYIQRTPPFRMAGRKFDSPEIGGKTGIILHEDRLELPLHWRNPRRVFVNSLADLFHDDVPTEHIAKVFATMARAERHTFQLLTKRPARMRSLLADGGLKLLEATSDETTAHALYDAPWPLPNVWVGTSVESQKWADIRIPQLLRTEAAVRFLSCEPLLGPIDLIGDIHAGHDWHTDFGQPVCLTCSTEDTTVAYFEREHRIDGIDWVIVGGESGPGARPMHPDWARSLRDQCNEAEVPYFFKQHGEWAPRSGLAPEDLANLWNEKRVTYVHPADGRTQSHGDWGMRDHLEGWAAVQRVGKHFAGRELDGRTWDEMPRVAEAVAS
jgi:protein gp37